MIVTIDHVSAECASSACDQVARAIEDVQIGGFARGRDMKLKAVTGAAVEIQEREIEELQQRLHAYEELMRRAKP